MFKVQLINREIPGGMCVYLAVPYISHVKHPKGHSVYGHFGVLCDLICASIGA